MEKLKYILKFAVGLFVPHTIAVIARDHLRKRRTAKEQAVRATLLQGYRANCQTAQFSFEDAVAFLAKEGLDEHQVREGSIPEAALAYCMVKLAELLDAKKPLVGLHVGNFVGISLGAFAAATRSLHPASFVVAIDPNIPCRGITHPQDKVAKLLNYFGLQDHVLLLCGYTMEKSLSNDGKPYTDYDPAASIAQEHGFEKVLPKLNALSPHRFDFAIIDGNHEQAYLEQELREVSRLLRPGGVLIIDDVCDHWFGVKAAFDKFKLSSAVKVVGENGRVGIVQLP